MNSIEGMKEEIEKIREDKAKVAKLAGRFGRPVSVIKTALLLARNEVIRKRRKLEGEPTFVEIDE